MLGTWALAGALLALVGHFRQGITVTMVQDDVPAPPATRRERRLALS
ncbi:hypothetical protein [Microbacterium sp. NPDC089695]